MQTTDLVSTAEAARILGCSIATVNRKAKAKQIEVAVQPETRTGGRWFRRDVIEAEASRRIARLTEALAGAA